jgi:hypothetical protein
VSKVKWQALESMVFPSHPTFWKTIPILYALLAVQDGWIAGLPAAVPPPCRSAANRQKIKKFHSQHALDLAVLYSTYVRM